MAQSLNIVKNKIEELPNNIEAEQAVLGSILVSNEIFDEIKDLLKGITPSRDDFDNDPDSIKPSTTSSVPKSSNKISPQTQ